MYVVFNTFFSLLTQDDQVRCFAAVADRLAPGGAFVLELFVPDPTLYPGGQSVRATPPGPGPGPPRRRPCTTRWPSGSTSSTSC